MKEYPSNDLLLLDLNLALLLLDLLLLLWHIGVSAQAQADYRFDFVLIFEDEGSVMSPTPGTPAPHMVVAVLTQGLLPIFAIFLPIFMGISLGGGLPP